MFMADHLPKGFLYIFFTHHTSPKIAILHTCNIFLCIICLWFQSLDPPDTNTGAVILQVEPLGFHMSVICKRQGRAAHCGFQNLPEDSEPL